MMTKVGFYVCAAVCLGGGVAHADPETVHLANGSVYAGELVEKVPGDHVTIKLASGEVRRFEWSELVPKTPSMQVQQQPIAPIAPVTPVQAPLVAPEQPQSAVPTLPPRPAHVRFNADTKGALLVRVDTLSVNNGVQPLYTTDVERPVCYAPCAADADANAHYYVRGAYISTSSRFAIPDGDSVLMARTGSDGASTAGVWMIAVGILSAITGAIATPVAFIDANTANGWNGWQYFGLTTLIAGGGLILLGIPFVVAGRTHVALGDMDVARHKVRWLPNGFQF
jgi:hypothetical protein